MLLIHKPHYKPRFFACCTERRDSATLHNSFKTCYNNASRTCAAVLEGGNMVSTTLPKSLFALGIISALLIVPGCTQPVGDGNTISGSDLNKIEEDNKAKENYLVIDVRSPEEYNAGHVKHAINMPLDKLESRLSEIDSYKQKNIVTVCNTGKKSGKAQELLQKKGFEHVQNAAGVKDFAYTTMTKAKSVLGPQFAQLVKQGNATIIDFRDEKDYQQGHMKGALHATPDTVLTMLDQIPKDKPVLTYCYSGNRSFAGAHKLAEQGYDVTNAIDGTKEYAHYELVK